MKVIVFSLFFSLMASASTKVTVTLTNAKDLVQDLKEGKLKDKGYSCVETPEKKHPYECTFKVGKGEFSKEKNDLKHIQGETAKTLYNNINIEPLWHGSITPGPSKEALVKGFNREYQCQETKTPSKLNDLSFGFLGKRIVTYSCFFNM